MRYQINVTDITGHLVSVTLTFNPQHPQHRLMLPAWIPGSYMIRDFARNIISIDACDDQGALVIKQTDKHSWQLNCRHLPVQVRYKVYAYDLSVRAAYIDDQLAVLNPASLCLAVDGQQHLPHQIELTPPSSRVTKNWRVATGLPAIHGTSFLSFGHYQANDYQHLIDCPIILGEFSLSQFDVEGVPHYLVITGNNLTDQARFTTDLQQICRQQVATFGALPDNLANYWFLLWVTADGYGGLEHMNSTLLLCSRFDLPIARQSKINDNYQNLLALCSHEYFHTWWVKRLKPMTFLTYELQQEQYTNQLWLYEGFTSYYDDLALVRSQVISKETYLTTLEKLITRVTRNPSNIAQSLLDSSFTAWTRFYKQDENAVNTVVSYYAKGALLALCLDAALRKAGSTLDNIVRQLWQQYQATGTPDDAVVQVLTSNGFTDLATQLTEWLQNAEALPLQQLLPALGLTLNFRAATHNEDLSGIAPSEIPTAALGALFKNNNGLLTISHVYQDGPAYNAGLMSGDQLLALGGYRITETSLAQLLQRFTLGSTQSLVVFRKDRLLQLEFMLQQSSPTVAMLNISDTASCNNWLNCS